jgi:hypothetical protein
MSSRHAHLSDDLVGRMMYVKENLVLLCEHYHELRKEANVKELHHLVNVEFNNLIAMDEDDKDFDVGKNNHLLDFYPACVDGILLSLSMKKGHLFSF